MSLVFVLVEWKFPCTLSLEQSSKLYQYGTYSARLYAYEQGHWSTLDVYECEPQMFWTEQPVPWDEPIYPEMDDDESPSPADEEESGSEFVPSGSASE